MPNSNNCLRYWDLADHIRIDDAIALWCGVEPAELASLNFETQCMSAKRAALVTALRTEHLEYEDLGILTARGCWRRPKTEPLCRLKFEPGLVPSAQRPAVDKSTCSASLSLWI